MREPLLHALDGRTRSARRRRGERGDERHAEPDDHGGDPVRGRSTNESAEGRTPRRCRIACSTSAITSPNATPDGGARSRRRRGLAHDGPGDLTGARADGAQQGELAGPLADTTIEKVLLMKKADTNSATAAKPSRMFRKTSMRPATRSSASGCDLGAGDRLDPVGERRLHARRRARWARRPARRRMSMLSTSSRPPNTSAATSTSNAVRRAPRRLFASPKVKIPTIVTSRLRAVGQQDRRAVADGEAVVGRGARSIATSPRPSGLRRRRACTGPQPVLVAPRHPDERGTGGRERLAVEVDELRVPAERRLQRRRRRRPSDDGRPGRPGTRPRLGPVPARCRGSSRPAPTRRHRR